MIEHTQITHHIQKHIISVLMYRKSARFSELRPPKTDTNLFSYHLKVLQKENLVKRLNNGYELSQKGLIYVDRLSNKLIPRIQPKIITMLLIQDDDGNVLLQKRTKQPYIDMWTLPNGKLHLEDASLQACAEREVREKVGLDSLDLKHIGDSYMRVKDTDGSVLTLTFAHIFRAQTSLLPEESPNLRWIHPRKLAGSDLAPGVDQVLARSFFNDPFFFEEFYTEL